MGRNAKKNRDNVTRRVLFRLMGQVCFYCGEPLTLTPNRHPDVKLATFDHVVPYLRGGRTAGNLVPSCTVCNQIAGSCVFPDAYKKRGHILRARLKLGWKFDTPPELDVESIWDSCTRLRDRFGRRARILAEAPGP